MRRVFIPSAVLCCAIASSSSAALVEGLSVRDLAPAEFSTSTILSIAPDPTGTVWYSNGATLFQVTQEGVSAASETLPGSTNDITFDADGRLYIHTGGAILRRSSPTAPWETFAPLAGGVRAMAFAQGGDLIVASSGGVTDPTTLYRVSPAGVITTIATNLPTAESFVFDANGNLLYAHYLTGDIYRVTLDDGVSTFVGNGLAMQVPWREPGFKGHVESIALTPDGKILLGVNMGVEEHNGILSGANRSRLDRYDELLDTSIVLGIDFSQGVAGARLPLDMYFDQLSGELLIAGHGSIVPLAITGNTDASFGGGLLLPEPGTLVLLGCAGMVLLGRGRTNPARTRGI